LDGDRVDRGQDRLHGTNAQRVDEEGRRRQRAQARPDDGHGSQDEGAGARNRELRQANEILRKASAYFAQAELDRRWKP
jgi:transposase